MVQLGQANIALTRRSGWSQTGELKRKYGGNSLVIGMIAMLRALLETNNLIPPSLMKKVHSRKTQFHQLVS